VSKLLVVNDGKRERELLLVERLVVGRDPACDISVDDGLLSRRHAEFVAASTAVTVRDLGSRNGIFVNGQRRAEQTLQPGDVVQIGPLRVRYLIDQAAGASAARIDADGTLMIPGPSSALPSAAAVSFAPPPPAYVDLELEDEDEGETRVISAASLGAAPGTTAGLDDATSFTPTPRTDAPLGAVAASTARAQQAPPAVTRAPVVTPAPAAPLGSFVLIQMGALAVIVFVATVTPIVLSQGTVLEAVTEGRLAAVLLWPILPLVIAGAATAVIANAVNRRVLHALSSGPDHMEGR
jgi:predicted component of type VI protein secretion system